MKPFEYQRAPSIDSAVALAASGGVFLAGGTNLVDHLRLGIRGVDRVVDINRLDFGGVEVLDDGGLRIGANVRNSDLAMDGELRRRFPFVSEALLAGASGQLRNMASTATTR
jgi:xanthine dehydrogenase YagS FAD-binding subunit